MRNLVVISDGLEINEELKALNIEAKVVDVRRGYDVENLMDIYETVDPSQAGIVREEIINLNPIKMVAVGKLEDYLWIGTIICRLFGQFNSWNDQREEPYGKTVLNVNGKSIELTAIASLEDWHYVG